jgi:hypothetical protein
MRILNCIFYDIASKMSEPDPQACMQILTDLYTARLEVNRLESEEPFSWDVDQLAAAHDTLQKSKVAYYEACRKYAVLQVAGNPTNLAYIAAMWASRLGTLIPYWCFDA